MNPENTTNKKRLFTAKTLFVVVVVLVLIAVAAVAWSINKKEADASNFSECKDAGGTIVDGTVASCEIGGKTFKETDQSNDDTKKEAANSDVAKEYLGMSEKDALEKAEKDNRAARVVERDGKSIMVTMDLRQGRLNFTIEDGVVTAVEEEAPNMKTE